MSISDWYKKNEQDVLGARAADLYPGKIDGYRLFFLLLLLFYSSDWSMRSCLRTFVWLVSLISPARNISSTTVYTLKHNSEDRAQHCDETEDIKMIQNRVQISQSSHPACYLSSSCKNNQSDKEINLTRWVTLLSITCFSQVCCSLWKRL